MASSFVENNSKNHTKSQPFVWFLLLLRTVIMIGLNGRNRCVDRVFGSRGCLLDELFTVFTAHSFGIHEQVGILDGGKDDTKEADAYAYALGVDVVVDIGGFVSRVTIDDELVVLLVGFPLGLVDLRGVGMGEDAPDVAHIVVDDVALDAVAGLQALADVVFRLPPHHAVGGAGDHGQQIGDGEDGQENDDLAQATVPEFLQRGLFLVGFSVKLLHI